MRARTLLLVAAMWAAGAVPAPAQTADQPARFPKFAEADFDNGIHLILLDTKGNTQTSFRLEIPGAGIDGEGDDRRGLARITAALMRERTLTRTPDAMAAEISE